VNPRKLRELMALADARKARDLARLDRLFGVARGLDAAAAAAAAAPRRDHADGGYAGAPMALQGTRQVWADHRVAEARRAQAALAPEIAAARAAAVQSLGKHAALVHLLARAERDAAAQLDARAERDAPSPAPKG